MYKPRGESRLSPRFVWFVLLDGKGKKRERANYDLINRSRDALARPVSEIKRDYRGNSSPTVQIFFDRRILHTIVVSIARVPNRGSILCSGGMKPNGRPSLVVWDRL